MSESHDADLSNVPKDVQLRLVQLADDYAEANTKEGNVRRRMQSRTARIRSAIGEVVDRYSGRLARIRRKRMALAHEILALWGRHAPELRQLVLPAGTIRRRTSTSATVRDKRAVIDSLDRLDRLDLVEETVNERKLAAVVRDNRDRFPEGSVDLVETPGISLHRKEDDDAPGA